VDFLRKMSELNIFAVITSGEVPEVPPARRSLFSLFDSRRTETRIERPLLRRGRILQGSDRIQLITEVSAESQMGELRNAVLQGIGNNPDVYTTDLMNQQMRPGEINRGGNDGEFFSKLTSVQVKLYSSATANPTEGANAKSGGQSAASIVCILLIILSLGWIGYRVYMDCFYKPKPKPKNDEKSDEEENPRNSLLNNPIFDNPIFDKMKTALGARTSVESNVTSIHVDSSDDESGGRKSKSSVSSGKQGDDDKKKNPPTKKTPNGKRNGGKAKSSHYPSPRKTPNSKKRKIKSDHVTGARAGNKPGDDKRDRKMQAQSKEASSKSEVPSEAPSDSETPSFHISERSIQFADETTPGKISKRDSDHSAKSDQSSKSGKKKAKRPAPEKKGVNRAKSMPADTKKAGKKNKSKPPKSKKNSIEETSKEEKKRGVKQTKSMPVQPKKKPKESSVDLWSTAEHSISESSSPGSAFNLEVTPEEEVEVGLTQLTSSSRSFQP